MILVFGGTTEGRRAVEVLEEAGSPFYYSTRGNGQQIELVNGMRLTGGMDAPQMTDFCREHGIGLIVDASHPFAEELHGNLQRVAGLVGVPIVRYDRIYPEHEADITWCKDYDDAIRLLEASHVTRLLTLTGVNTIGKLRRYWENHRDCWFRILSREASYETARRQGFPENRLVDDEAGNTSDLIARLRPQAILTKESGRSGGFEEKVEAARRAGVGVFVIERPAYHPPTPKAQPVQIRYVNGPYGLRRAVEQLLPTFFRLHSGLTTGTCATAAAIAAATRLTTGEMPEEVAVMLPNGETIGVRVGYGNDYAYCIKEAGDDPDITDGVEVRASVRRSEAFGILGGEGVGTITLPGFDYPPGSPAINRGPREMIRQNVKEDVEITISVPHGAEIARKTFNPRLGIEGGLSIIGVSGIVKPFSEEAFVDSIRKCMTIARASGADRVVINSGGKSERFVKALYPDLPRQAFVEYGNYVGETLKMAHDLGFRRVTLGVMLGKAVKLAAGNLDTHSRKTVMDKVFVGQMLKEAGCDMDISGITLARELWDSIPAERTEGFAHSVIAHCHEHCRGLLPDGELTILLIDDNGRIYGR